MCLTSDARSSNNSILLDNQDGEDADIVPVVALDSFWDKSVRIDMLKVDIEGHEYKFLIGAEKTVKSNMPMIYMEYSDLFQRLSSGKSGEELLCSLIEFGYRIEILHRSGQAEKVTGGTHDTIQRVTAALAETISRNGTHLDLYLESSLG
jgi:hypothetical protein